MRCSAGSPLEQWAVVWLTDPRVGSLSHRQEDLQRLVDAEHVTQPLEHGRRQARLVPSLLPPQKSGATDPEQSLQILHRQIPFRCDAKKSPD